MNFAMIGAGFSCAVIADFLAQAGHKIDVFESRDHVAGNCYTERDRQSGIMIHRYGPHIFHTNYEQVWRYVNSFTKFMPYINRVKTTVRGQVYSMPVNLHTINQFFNTAMSPSEAESFIDKLSISTSKAPETFEEQALQFVGRELYEAFFKGYTEKQWGISPANLPASILKRLPLRFNYDDNYFSHKYQGIPIEGYTPIIEKMLSHNSIDTHLSTPFKKDYCERYDHVIFSGPIDSWFDYKLGKLPYRTLDFIKELHVRDYQGCAVMNYPDKEVPYTRITEHKHFAPWESHDKTVIYKEFSRSCEEGDTPYYPIRSTSDKRLLNDYIKLASSTKKVSFVGRLGTYRYLDMDTTIHEAMLAAEKIIKCTARKERIPTFFIDPL